MHELYTLKEVAEQQLLPAGFVRTREETHPDHFGSYFAVYSRRGHEIRFVWDGKDGWGFLEHREEGSDPWEPVGSPVAEASRVEMKKSAAREWSEALAPLIA